MTEDLLSQADQDTGLGTEELVSAEPLTGPVPDARATVGTPRPPQTDQDETLLRRWSPRERLERSWRRVDPIGWLPATAAVARKAARHPADLAAVGPRDKRFADPAWEQHPFFYGIRGAYLASCRLFDEVAAAGSVDPGTDATAGQFRRLVQDLAAPTNVAPTNPDVLTKAFQTGGMSLLSGARLAAADILQRGGRPMKVDRGDFQMGRTLAATRGTVIFRNDLVELIQYEPQTKLVHQTPVLFSPPWINKYYVMDLAPGRSFAEWAVRQQRTVFVLSYINPDASMREVTFEDYLLRGTITAVQVVQEVTNADTVDLVGLCLGGLSAAIAAAYLQASGEDTVGSLTLLNTMLDYRDPGELGVMTSPQMMQVLEERMAGKGYLSGADMSLIFDLLRANDLIFSYVVSRWLKGEPPPAFDILAWNEDATRVGQGMHATYLQNTLAAGEFTLNGTRLNLAEVTADAYVVGAVNDHIVAWHSSYATTGLLGGDVQYVRSSGGHIAGIVNPPNPTAWFETLDQGAPNPPDADRWQAAATRHRDTWWQHWSDWSNSRAGDLVSPPKIGGGKHRPLCDAPGTYVLT